MVQGSGKISVALATSLSLGAIIGAGIYVLSGTAIALAGTEALIAFVVVGIVALMVALQLGELGSIMPKLKGAAYSYAREAFGSEIGFITGIMLFFSYSTMISVIALGFGSYLSSMLGMQGGAYPLGFAVALIAILSAVNLLGIRRAARTDFALVTTKILILLLFVAAGLCLAFSHTGASPISNITHGTGNGLGGLFAASVVIFFAYTGFQTISTFTDKVKGGARAAGRAIVYSVVISMVLYVAVTLVLMLMLPASSYKISGDPLSFALSQSGAPRWLFIVVDLGALVATASATLAAILMSSRLIYQVGSDGLLPRFVKKFDSTRDVAVNGVLVSSVIAIVMLFSGNIYVIASISNVGIFLSYLMTCFALLHFRRHGTKGRFRSPLYPYLSIISIALLLAFFAGLPTEALLIGIVLIILLLIIYYFLREVEDKKIVKVRLFR
jgi:APA family basic amino acid/polyamine antiporter